MTPAKQEVIVVNGFERASVLLQTIIQCDRYFKLAPRAVSFPRDSLESVLAALADRFCV